MTARGVRVAKCDSAPDTFPINTWARVKLVPVGVTATYHRKTVLLQKKGGVRGGMAPLCSDTMVIVWAETAFLQVIILLEGTRSYLSMETMGYEYSPSK